jgi:uncharacterized protein YjbJ (UPF0337 family)
VWTYCIRPQYSGSTPDARCDKAILTRRRTWREEQHQSARNLSLCPLGIYFAGYCKQEETIMSSTEDKVKGTTNEAVGNVKQGVGAATDNEQMQAEGKAQETKGEAQQTLGKAKDTVSDALHNAADKLKGS